MNLPFGLPVIKETGVRRREDFSDAVVQYERKLAEYREVLESYRKQIKEYSGKLEGYERRLRDNQLDHVQTSLDLTYLKEQGEKSTEILHQLKAVSNNKPYVNLDAITLAIDDTSHKIEELNKDVKIIEENLNSYGKNMLTMAIHTDSMNKSLDNIMNNVEGLDKNVVNRLSEFLLELQKQHIYQNRQLQIETVADIEKLNQATKKNRILLWFILIFNFFGLCSIAFLVLYYLEIIPL